VLSAVIRVNRILDQLDWNAFGLLCPDHAQRVSFVLHAVARAPDHKTTNVSNSVIAVRGDSWDRAG